MSKPKFTYGEYFIEGEKGETFYSKNKTLCHTSPEFCAKAIADVQCIKEYPGNQVKIGYCREGIENLWKTELVTEHQNRFKK